MKSVSRAAGPAPWAAPAIAPCAPEVGDDPTRPPRPPFRAAIIATAVGLTLFLLIQGILAAYNVHVVRDAIDRGLTDSYPSIYRYLPLRLTTALIGGSIGYLILAVAGSAIASRGHRLFMLPAASYVLVAVAIGEIHRPQAIGDQWRVECFSMNFTCAGPWFGHPWFGPLLDLALALLPGWAVAVRARPRRWPEFTDAPAVAALLGTVSLVAMAGWTIAVIEAWVDVPAMIAVGAFGIAIGTARPWWPWLHVLLATLVVGATGSLAWLVSSIFLPAPGASTLDGLRYMAVASWPMIAVGLLASAWQPLAWLLRRLQERPLRLLLAVNLLNVVDAVMTAVAVRSGGALEANPLVRFGGLPAKVVLVGVLTWFLYRRRPTALVWPAAALLWVACYHVSGILVNGWRA